MSAIGDRYKVVPPPRPDPDPCAEAVNQRCLRRVLRYLLEPGGLLPEAWEWELVLAVLEARGWEAKARLAWWPGEDPVSVLVESTWKAALLGQDPAEPDRWAMSAAADKANAWVDRTPYAIFDAIPRRQLELLKIPADLIEGQYGTW